MWGPAAVPPVPTEVPEALTKEGYSKDVLPQDDASEVIEDEGKGGGDFGYSRISSFATRGGPAATLSPSRS